MLRNTSQKKLLSRCVLRDTPKSYWEGDSRHSVAWKKKWYQLREFSIVWIKYLWFLRLLTQINLPFHLFFCERKTAYYFRSLRCQACVSCRCNISFFFVSLTLKLSIAAFLRYLYIWINHTVSRSFIINLFPGQSPKNFVFSILFA